MTYVKIFLDIAGGVEMLSDEERGRLFLAILRYAGAGELPELPGNERFLWNTFKWQMDRSREKYQQKVDAASKSRKKSPAKRPPSTGRPSGGYAADYSELFDTP